MRQDPKYRQLLEMRDRNKENGEETEIELLRKQGIWMKNDLLQCKKKELF